MKTSADRIVLAGTGSGCGKTTVTCAVLQALVNRGVPVGAFKCGPDYIDPMFHRRIIGAKSGNLDGFFCEENTLRYLLAKNAEGCRVSIIEGVMGFYDGMGLTSTRASTYETAQTVKAPVVLVVDAKGASLSVLAVIRGFLDFRKDNGICGVILNRCTAMTYPALAGAMEEEFGGRVRPLGYLPAMPECALESRHLGLVTADEVEDLKEKTGALARQAEKSLDLDGLLELAAQAEALEFETPDLPAAGEPVRIAVARDRAFCFYYEDSLELLEQLGAEPVPFSPLEDPKLPENIHGLYLGGGYPELYAEKLCRNTGLLAEIRTRVTGGLPCIAECGGFMYLTEAIGDLPMAGVLPGGSRDTGKLTRFGYVTLQAQKDTMLCRAGEEIAGHEFHHWDSDDCGCAFTARKANGRSWSCVHANGTLYAGYPHFHFYSNPAFAQGFLTACRKEKHRYD